MDYESSDSRSKGAWDPKTLLAPFYEKWCSTTPTPDFVVDDVWCGMVGSLGFGAGATAEVIQFWTGTLKSVYTGDEGRKKLKVALACLLERDGLLLRVRDVVCPVYWLQVSFALHGHVKVPMLTENREPKMPRLGRRFQLNKSSCSLRQRRRHSGWSREAVIT
jgi:hypothetical protein